MMLNIYILMRHVDFTIIEYMGIDNADKFNGFLLLSTDYLLGVSCLWE